MSSDKYDYIIAGAGSAGCVLANRLSADPNIRVLLLEAGGQDNNPWIHIPVGYFKTLHNPETDWCYETEPDPGLNGRSLEWPRGKTLGGSSSINGLLYIRGQSEDYDYWRQLGNAGWSYDDVLPYFKRSENNERGGDDHHGEGGGLSVSNMRAERTICEAFIDAAVELGVPRSDDFNGERQEGAGYFQLTSANGRRCSAAVAFLRPAANRKNLDIVTHAHVEQLAFAGDDKSAVDGIKFSVNGEKREAKLHAGGEVVLAAGAIGSPQILQLSGIGPGELLRDNGIEVRHEKSDVGQNLQDHLQIRMIYEVNVPTLNDEINNLARR
ncbi:MAG: GMC family oxidoreductase N-terminal domain-containing protein, partial [Pseudomonadota bacterium]